MSFPIFFVQFVLTLCKSIAGFIKYYNLLVTIRIYLSWFPNINLYMQPFLSLKKITDPFLLLFRGLVPNIFGFDLSPILGFMLLNCLQEFFNAVTYTIPQ